MPRPISARIHLDAVRQNLQLVKRMAPSSRVWSVIKANAYGHGIERIYPALAEADGMALLDLDEAVRVRELGWTKPILLLEGIFEPADVETADRHRLTVTVHCDEQLALLKAARPSERIRQVIVANKRMELNGVERAL